MNGPTYSTPVAVSPVPETGNPNQTAMNFNGTNQSVQIPDSPAFALTSSLTLEAYVNTQFLSPPQSDGNIIFRGDDRPGLDPYRLTAGFQARVQ